MSQPRVPTGAVKKAVAGHETDVLDALGIPWRDGRPHIACPYPSHGGANDWRFDERQAKAHCTCQEKPHSIFDVVMLSEGLDFEEAKRRVAEIIGRRDLLPANGNGQYQKQDPASLLNAQADRRDDTLPRAYLAHRLGIEAGEVPMPCTAAVGFKALAYFDPPPQGRKAKPKKVGDYPATVWEMAGPNSSRHAHRIFVAEGGAGKAKLPGDRDPKKLCSVPKGQESTAGLAVLWGVPKKAPHILLAEGIETAAAVAYAFRKELDAGRVAVAAAIHAAGIEHFTPWEATERVTVCADRDEGDNGKGKTRDRRGEVAARRFGLTHHGRLAVSIVLPGEPGEKVDWLDILRRDGLNAVRQGIEESEPFDPSEGEVEAEIERRETVGEFAAVRECYPLPKVPGSPLSIRDDEKDGTPRVHVWTGKDRDKETGEEVDKYALVSSPFGVPARLRYADQAEAFGLRIVLESMGEGEPRTVDFMRGELAKMGASEIRRRLLSEGIRFYCDGEGYVSKYLKGVDPVGEVLVVSRPGWHRLPGMETPLFATPSGAIIGGPDGQAVELEAGAVRPDAVKGSLEGWQEAVATAAHATNAPHFTLGILAGFAGVVLEMAGFDFSCGVNLSGFSSAGKTTAQRLAVSPWTSPEIGRGLLVSMRATENSLENLCVNASGTVLALDELAHADGRTVGRAVYAIAQGMAKSRQQADGALRQAKTWRTFAVLSCELSLEEKVVSEGGKWQAGMGVRLCDVDVTGIAKQPPEVMDALQGVYHHHGHAGPAFVRRLVSEGMHETIHREELRRTVEELSRTFEGAAEHSTMGRAALAFALLELAGSLGIESGVLPSSLPAYEAVRWAWERFTESSDACALDPSVSCMMNLEAWLAERKGSTVKRVDGENVDVNNREAVGWYDDNLIYIPSQRLHEATGLKEAHASKVLDEAGFISRQQSDRIYSTYVPGVGKVRHYRLDAGKLRGRNPHEETHKGRVHVFAR